jgi:hypothetical protein
MDQARKIICSVGVVFLLPFAALLFILLWLGRKTNDD